jgi:CRISPR-associated DxTHG motif protein
MKAITFLGATIAHETTYVMPDGREHTAPFFGAALARFVPDLSMRIFVTAKAREMHLARFEELVSDYVADLEPIDIPNGADEAQLWKIFQAVVDTVGEGEAVIFDITHGFRSLPFLAFLASAYLRTVKDIQLHGVYYGNWEAGDKSVTPNRAPVIDLTHFVSLLDWMVAADRFTRFGDARDLADLLRAQHERIKPDYRTASKSEMATWSRSPVTKTVSNLNRASRALRVVRPSEAMDASHAVRSQLPNAMQSIEALAQPFVPLSQHVVDSFASIALTMNDQQSDPLAILTFERSLIGWYLQRNQIFQAVALAREWLVSWVMAQVGLSTQMMDKDARRRVEDAIGRVTQRLQDKTFVDNEADVHFDLSTVPSLYDVANLYNQLGDLRNDLAHAGKRQNARTAEVAESAAQELCRKLNDMVVA